MTNKMRLFAVFYAETREAKKSCLRAGYSDSYSKSKSHLLLKNPEVMEEVTNLTKSYYENQFQELSIAGVKKLSTILNDDEDRATQLRAIKMIFQLARVVDRHGDVEKIESETVFKVLIPPEYERFRNDNN